MTTEPDADGLQMKLIMDSDLLQDVVDALSTLVDEARFMFLDGLIRTWELDPANAGGCYIDLKPSQREDQIKHYSVDPDGFQMGINLGKLDDLLSYSSAGDLIQIEYGEKHQWKFHITLPSVDVDMAGIDPEQMRNQPDRPELDWPAKFKVSGSQFKDAVNLNDMFSGHTTIEAGNHQVEFLAEGDTDSGSYHLEEPEEVEFFDHPDDMATAMFSLDYLEDMAKVLKDYPEVVVKTGNEIPGMFETELFTMMLAPRITER